MGKVAVNHITPHPRDLEVITPSVPAARGCQLSLKFSQDQWPKWSQTVANMILQINSVAKRDQIAASKFMTVNGRSGFLDLKETACLATFSALEKRGIVLIPET